MSLLVNIKNALFSIWMKLISSKCLPLVEQRGCKNKKTLHHLSRQTDTSNEDFKLFHRPHNNQL